MWNFLDLSKLGRPLIFVDLPGHGLSSTLRNENASLVDFAVQVEKLLNDLDCTTVSVVGHSMGGYVALELLNRGCSLEKLVLLNSHPFADSPAKREDRMRVADLVFHRRELFIKESIRGLFAFPNLHEEVISLVTEQALTMSAEAIAQSSLAMAGRPDYTHILSSAECACYSIQGKLDNIIPLDLVLELQDFTEKFLIDDCGHMAHIEASQRVEESLLDVFRH